MLAADGAQHAVTSPTALARRTYAAMMDVLTPDLAQQDVDALWASAAPKRRATFVSAARAALAECSVGSTELSERAKGAQA